MADEPLMYLQFSRVDQLVRYARTAGEFAVELLFEKSRWYRLAYCRDLDYTNPAGDRYPAEFYFLEHPDLPGVAIGFRRDTFFIQ